jgi:hypothetical protein
MPYKLACFISRISKTQAIDCVVQSPFQKRKKEFSCNPFLSVRLFEGVEELVFQNTVKPFDFLLFSKLGAISREFFPSLAVLSRRITPPVDGALLRITSLSFEKELEILPPAEPTNRFRVSCQR